MNNRLKKLIRNSIPERVKKFLTYSIESEYVRASFSQHGEDLLLESFFPKQDEGYYVDVGAYHPIRFSNSYLFYLKGWNGLTIDATPGRKVLFDKYRDADTHVEAAISDSEEELTLYNFKEPLQNTFSEEAAAFVQNAGINPLLDKVTVKSRRLAQIFDENVPLGTTIDFLSIDTEGFDLKVLMSINWDRFTPNLVLIEDLEFDFSQIQSNSIWQFMASKDYEMVARSFNSSVFIHRKQLNG